jgi:hypothetical protein
VSTNDLIASLIAVLESEERLYLELRDVLQDERLAILELDAARLETAVNTKAALVDEVQLFEESRRDLALRLASELGVAEPRLTSIAAASPLRSDELGDLASRLRAITAAVRELLQLNATLSGESLGQVRLTLELLGRLQGRAPLYDASGSAPSSNSSSLLRQTV